MGKLFLNIGELTGFLKKSKEVEKLSTRDKMYWNPKITFPLGLLVKIGHVKQHKNTCVSFAFHVLWINEIHRKL